MNNDADSESSYFSTDSSSDGHFEFPDEDGNCYSPKPLYVTKDQEDLIEREITQEEEDAARAIIPSPENQSVMADIMASAAEFMQQEVDAEVKQQVAKTTAVIQELANVELKQQVEKSQSLVTSWAGVPDTCNRSPMPGRKAGPMVVNKEGYMRMHGGIMNDTVDEWSVVTKNCKRPAKEEKSDTEWHDQKTSLVSEYALLYKCSNGKQEGNPLHVGTASDATCKAMGLKIFNVATLYHMETEEHIRETDCTPCGSLTDHTWILNFEAVKNYIETRVKHIKPYTPWSNSTKLSHWQGVWSIALNHPQMDMATLELYQAALKTAEQLTKGDKNNQELTSKEKQNTLTKDEWESANANMRANITATCSKDKKATESCVEEYVLQAIALLALSGEFVSRNEMSKTAVGCLDEHGTLHAAPFSCDILADGHPSIENFDDTKKHILTEGAATKDFNWYIQNHMPKGVHNDGKDLFLLCKFKSAASGGWAPEMFVVPDEVSQRVRPWLERLQQCCINVIPFQSVTEQQWKTPTRFCVCKNAKGEMKPCDTSDKMKNIYNLIFNFTGKKISSRALRRFHAVSQTGEAIAGVLPIIRKFRHSLSQHINGRYLLEFDDVPLLNDAGELSWDHTRASDE